MGHNLFFDFLMKCITPMSNILLFSVYKMYINKMEAMYGRLCINEKSNLAQILLFLCSHTWLLYYLCN